MQKKLRIALPSCVDLTPETVCAFALLSRNGALLRKGELPLRLIAASLSVKSAYLILPPNESTVVNITLPPVKARQMNAAVISSIEPMALTDIADLCIAYGRRGPGGNLVVAWAERNSIISIWNLLVSVGLHVSGIVPHALLENTDSQSVPPVDSLWLSRLPDLSFDSDELRPGSQLGRWLPSLYWAIAAALLWLLGLQIYAIQMRNEAQFLQRSIERSVQEHFPQIPVVIAPVKQARDALEDMRLAQGMAKGNDFITLALDSAASLDFLVGNVKELHYENGILTLKFLENFSLPDNWEQYFQAAERQSLILKKDKGAAAHNLKIRRPSDLPGGGPL